MKVLLLYPDKNFEGLEKVPNLSEDVFKDLEMATLLTAMAQKDEYLLNASKQIILAGLSSIESIQYRQEIVKDCLAQPEQIRKLYKITFQSMVNKRDKWLGIYSHHPSGILAESLQLLDMYLGLLKKIRKIALESKQSFHSKGFQRFFEMIIEELNQDYVELMESTLKELRFFNGVLLSAKLGTGNEGKDYVLRKKHESKQSWSEKILGSSTKSYSYTLDIKDNYGSQVLKELKDFGLNDVANATAQSAEHIDNFFKVLRFELAFYIGCLNLHDKITSIGGKITFPIPKPSIERVHSFEGLYDLSLALTIDNQPVPNDLNLNNKNLIIITGANQGGKSTFLRSIGIAQIMMMCGMYVPASTFSANISKGMFTHFKREEDTSMTSGKFDEELERMSEIIDAIKADSLILYNESFASTNEQEGSEIAFQITRALLNKQIKIFYVTHLFTLANKYFTLHEKDQSFLRAQRSEDGTRTFKLLEAEPLQTSFGKDLYHKMFSSTSD